MFTLQSYQPCKIFKCVSDIVYIDIYVKYMTDISKFYLHRSYHCPGGNLWRTVFS